MTAKAKRISFFRQYSSYTGGHQKVRDYLDHFIALGWQVVLYVEATSSIQPSLFNDIEGVEYQNYYDPSQADVVFLAGMDWQHYLPLGITDKPIINLVQHVRHADSSHPLFAFLPELATRLCVSEAVRTAIMPFANGACHSIKMGHHVPVIDVDKSLDLYILATKQPALGKQLLHWATNNGLRVQCHDHSVEKQAVLRAMAKSRITLALPHQTEGFYLPGIEAASLSNIAIVPDCIASREYSKPFTTILSCELEQASIIQTLLEAQTVLQSKLLWLRQLRTRKIIAQYSYKNERQQLTRVLRQL